MIQPHRNTTSHRPNAPGPVDLGAIIKPERIALELEASSKKRLLELLSGLLLRDSNLDAAGVFQILIERERLGSTGIGNGIAIPHGRVRELTEPIGAFARLAQPIDFDALDHQPVTMVFGLLVPGEATQQHLQILARLASLFNDPAFREALATAGEVDEIHRLLTEARP